MLDILGFLLFMFWFCIFPRITILIIMMIATWFKFEVIPLIILALVLDSLWGAWMISLFDNKNQWKNTD